MSIKQKEIRKKVLNMKALNILYLIIGVVIVLIGIIAVLDGQLIALINFVIGSYFISNAVRNFYYL